MKNPCNAEVSDVEVMKRTNESVATRHRVARKVGKLGVDDFDVAVLFHEFVSFRSCALCSSIRFLGVKDDNRL